MKISGDGRDIRSLEDWFRYAPPKGREAHWVDGRSAKELARAWFPTPGEPVVPPELLRLLESHPDIADATLSEGFPEHVVQLDSFPGETRNADLILLGRCQQGPMLVSVEAKADEEFGPTLAGELKLAKSDQSNIPSRVNSLCGLLLGTPYADDPSLAALRYQLFTGCGGAIIEAKRRGASLAVFCVHEFVGRATDTAKVERNDLDLDAFVCRVSSGVHRKLAQGKLLGPFGGGSQAGLPFYIGKVVRDLSANSA